MACEHCHGEGMVFTQNKEGRQKAYACSCPSGERHRQPMFAPIDKEKARPIYMPVYQPRKVLSPQTWQARYLGEKED